MLAVLSLLLGIALLYRGADRLVGGSAALALRLGMAPLVIGLTVVAFGTSMPELVVSLRASASGDGAIAVGNVVGSNIANAALILGLSALIRPLKVELRVVRLDLPILVAVSALLALCLADDRLGRWEGSLFFAGLLAYLWLLLVLARRDARQLATASSDDVALPSAAPGWAIPLGLIMLIAGAELMVSGAVTLARALGVGEAVIGLTVVALGTSLPELSTSLVAASRGQGDIAVGNVVGSNIFNILGILGLASLLRPIAPTGMSAVDVGVMLALSVCLLPFLRSGLVISRWEGGALLAAYAGYLLVLLLR